MVKVDAASTSVGVAGSTTVLVIDDETLVRQSFKDYLEDFDYRVLEAENGRQGLELFFRQRPELVLVDLRMPQVDGLEVLEQVKATSPNTPVIVISGTGAIADVVEALHLGADDYLLKPLENLSILRHAMEKALERARLIGENQAYQKRLEQRVEARTQDLARANEELSLVNRRLRQLVESTRRLSICRGMGDFCEQLLREFARHMPATGGSLYLLREGGVELVSSLEENRSPAFLSLPLPSGTVLQQVLAERRPVLIEDLAFESQIDCRPWPGEPVGSLLAFPLVDKDQGVMGVLALHNRVHPPFTEQDREIGKILASFSAEMLRSVRMSEALQQSEEMFRTITGSAQDAIFMVDADVRIGYWNRAAEQIFGWSEEQIKGRDLCSLIAPDHCLPDYQGAFGRCRREKGLPSGTRITTAARRKDGSEFPVELSLAGVEIHQRGSVIGILRDISEQQRAEERIRLLATATEQAAESIVVIDPSGRILYVNPAFEQTTGYTREESIGRHLSLLEDRQDPMASYQRLWSALEQGRAWQGRLANCKKNGTRYPADATFAPVRSAEGQVVNFVSVQRDVSHERELESRLRQAQKMEAIGTLAGGIAHDFNNILSAIMGYSELALMQLEPGSRTHRSVEKVIRAGERAADLVQQILTFSRQAEVRRKPVLVQPIAKEAMKLLRSTLPTTISIRQEIDPRCGPVMADPTQIHQVLMNLCTNAYHAMRDSGGELEVSIREVENAEKMEFAGEVLGPGRYACVLVRDSGCGMDSETMKRIFDPYFTTKPKGEGTGLGLATVHGIVQSHEGAIEVESEPGEGTSFRIYLPLCPLEADAKTMSPEDLTRWRGTERILLVDDEPSVTEVGQLLLEHNGYRVTYFNDSTQALQVFQNQPDDFDLVITDLTMPRLTGLNLAREVLKIRPDVPIIVCSGYSDRLNIQTAQSIGIREYVTKPISGHELLKSVYRILHS